MDLPCSGPSAKSACIISGLLWARRSVGSARIAVVIHPPEPSIARRDLLVCGIEANRCEQACGSADRGVIAVARPLLLIERCGKPPLGAVMFLA
jgi:hypothetical protein